MNRPEEALHRQVVAYLRVALPPSIPFWSVPNQRGTRTRAEMGVLKALGVKPGVPDLCFVMPTGVAAFIELKAPKGKLTDSQTTFKDIVQNAGAWWAEARSLEDVEAILLRWLTPLGHKLKARV